MQLGLRRDRFDVPHEPDVDTGSRFTRTALSVLEGVGHDLVGTSVSLVLADERAQVIERLVDDPDLQERFDRMSLTRGHRWSERCVDTNAVGTALEPHTPSLVYGREHFAEALAAFGRAFSTFDC